MMAGISGCAPEFQCTVAFLFSNETVALWTPGTLWMAWVTCRTQFWQFMPLT
jgi:hypothetical protein